MSLLFQFYLQIIWEQPQKDVPGNSCSWKVNNQKFELLHAFLGIATFKKYNFSFAASTYYCFDKNSSYFMLF